MGQTTFKKSFSFRLIAITVLMAFAAGLPVNLSFAQESFVLPPVGQMVHMTHHFEPPQMVGIKIDPQNPFSFGFVMDRGENLMSQEDEKDEFNKIIKYFLVSLAMPNKDMWVNLSPYESNRIIPEIFGETEMGRDLLAQDYILKQFTASLIYPEDGLGKKFWDKVYAQAQERFGTTNIKVNTFNKVWIVADKADVYQKGNTAFLLDSHLKVMLEQDYLAMNKHNVIEKSNAINSLGSQVVREIIIPAIEKEVNEGRNFAAVRQVYNAEIMATWYKKTLKQSLLGQVFADKTKIDGQKLDNPKQMKDIYTQYLSAYKRGVFNYIKEDSTISGEIIPRKYFSGGMMNVSPAMVTIVTPTALAPSPHLMGKAGDFAMLVSHKRLVLALTVFAIGMALIPTVAHAQPSAHTSVQSNFFDALFSDTSSRKMSTEIKAMVPIRRRAARVAVRVVPIRKTVVRTTELPGKMGLGVTVDEGARKIKGGALPPPITEETDPYIATFMQAVFSNTNLTGIKTAYRGDIKILLASIATSVGGSQNFFNEHLGNDGIAFSLLFVMSTASFEGLADAISGDPNGRQANIGYGSEIRSVMKIIHLLKPAERDQLMEVYRDRTGTKRITPDLARKIVILLLPENIKAIEDYIGPQFRQLPPSIQVALVQMLSYQTDFDKHKNDQKFVLIRDLIRQGKFLQAADVIDTTFFAKYGERVMYMRGKEEVNYIDPKVYGRHGKRGLFYSFLVAGGNPFSAEFTEWDFTRAWSPASAEVLINTLEKMGIAVPEGKTPIERLNILLRSESFTDAKFAQIFPHRSDEIVQMLAMQAKGQPIDRVKLNRLIMQENVHAKIQKTVRVKIKGKVQERLQEEDVLIAPRYIDFGGFQVSRVRPLAPEDIDRFMTPSLWAQMGRVGQKRVSSGPQRVKPRIVQIRSKSEIFVRRVAFRDQAMIAPGGIDLNDEHLILNIKTDGQGMPLPAQYQDAALLNLKGLTSVIREIIPVTLQNAPALLGS